MKVEGNFAKGDIIEIVSEGKQKLGYGIVEYGADRAKGLVGMKNAKSIIHCNHMFIGQITSMDFTELQKLETGQLKYISNNCKVGLTYSS